MALRGQRGRVDQHSVALHAVEGLARIHLELVDEEQLLVGLQARPERVVHVQRLVAVLARVFGGLGDVDLAERDLVRALAAQVFVRDAAAAQVALGQARKAVRLVHFEHVALQHGVVRVALHLDAVVGEHVPVVLDVLAELLLRAVLQPGLELRQHLVDGQLLGRIGVVVRERNVGGLAGRHAEADADDLRDHLVERGGLGVDGGKLSRLELREPGLELLPGRDGLVLQVARGRGGFQRLHVGGLVEQAALVGIDLPGSRLLLEVLLDQFGGTACASSALTRLLKPNFS